MVSGAPYSPSTAGRATLPSSRWPFSSSAMIVRPTATAVPLSVCSVGAACRPPARSGCPGAAPGSRSCSSTTSARGSAPGRAATPRGRTSWPPRRRGRRPRCSRRGRGSRARCRISSSMARSRSCSAAAVLGVDEREHLDLVELVHAEDPPRVAPGGAGLAAEARREAGVAQRQRAVLEDLAGVQRGERDLARCRRGTGRRRPAGRSAARCRAGSRCRRAPARAPARAGSPARSRARAASPAPSARARARASRGRP